MVTELVQYIGDKCLEKSEAECLLAGITLDTKNFTLKAGVRTFEAAAYLRKKGADISDCEYDHYDPAGHHYSVSCVKYISNIIK